MKKFVILCLLSFTPLALVAQSGASDTFSQANSSADVVNTEVLLSKKSVPVGSTVEAAVVLKISEGWHVNAHRPTLDYLIGTKVSLQGKNGI